jgi:hypothetical protein
MLPSLSLLSSDMLLISDSGKDDEEPEDEYPEADSPSDDIGSEVR